MQAHLAGLQAEAGATAARQRGASLCRSAKWNDEESNPGLPACEADTLPLRHHPALMYRQHNWAHIVCAHSWKATLPVAAVLACVKPHSVLYLSGMLRHAYGVRCAAVTAKGACACMSALESSAVARVLRFTPHWCAVVCGPLLAFTRRCRSSVAPVLCF